MRIISRMEARKLGFKRFFSGKPCPRGHVAERLVSNGTCAVCTLEKQNEKNAAAKAARGDIRGPRERAKEFGAVNYFTGVPCSHGHVCERRVSDAKCRECIKIKNRSKNSKRKEYLKPFITAAQAKRRGTEGKFTRNDILYKLEKQRFKCIGCGKNISKKYHVDHIIPLAKGGTNWPNNIQCLCPPCNLSKSAKDPIVWAQENWRLL